MIHWQGRGGISNWKEENAVLGVDLRASVVVRTSVVAVRRRSVAVVQARVWVLMVAES